MKYLNKLATVICGAAMSLTALTGCEGDQLYSVNAPENIQDIIDSIAKTKVVVEEDLSDCKEDVYTIGSTDFLTGWWAQFSKYYVIPDGKKFKAQFQLSINPNATNTYKNFALIVTNDVNRGDDGYKEYGAIRFDHQPSGNSEWGDFINRDLIESTLTFGSDTDDGVQKLGGTVTLIVDRTVKDSLGIKMTNQVVTKTYKQDYALTNLNADAGNGNIRIFLVPEGSYINFLKANIEPIGGFTSAEDKVVSDMILNGVPDEVLLGTSLDKAMESVSATVSFEGVPAPKEIPAPELFIMTGDDMNTPGEKKVTIIYNKTFKGANADKPAVKFTTIKVVSELSAFTQKIVHPAPQVLGATDNSTAFWGAHTENVKIEPRQTAVVSFINYGSGAGNWNNYNIVLNGEDVSKEYAVVRADNYGWGAGYEGCQHELSPAPEDDEAWAAWREAMNGAHVTAYITNNGNGTADIKTVATGTNGKEYVMTYTGIKAASDNLYFRFTIDGSHLVFESSVGLSDCSTPWWTSFSQNIQIPSRTACTLSFTNYTNAITNWNNFCVVLNKKDASQEYGVVRADNFGWGTGYDGCQHDINPTPADDQEWAAWRNAMNGAKVDMTITNKGNGTADIKAVMHGTNGTDYTVSYTGMKGIDKDDLYFRLVCEGSFLNFYSEAAAAKRFIQVNKAKVLYR